MQRIYSVDKNKVCNFHGLQQQHKQLETIEMAYSGPIIYDKGCVSIPTWTHSQNSPAVAAAAAEVLTLQTSSNGTSL